MANIAVICEGVSEFKILESIVDKYCNEDHYLNAIQPSIRLDDMTQEGFGGWLQVLNHCNEEKFEEIFQYNDFLILQIDTDSSHLSPFDVNLTLPDGTKKSDLRLHAEVKRRLLKDISHNVRKKYLSKILFAICNNEIECWFLPLFYSDNNACRNHNCIKILNRALARKNLSGLPENDKNSPNARKTYREIFKLMRKRDEIARIAIHHPGFKFFLQGLDSI